MKKSKKAALCGVMAAMSAVLMLGSYFPYFTYAIPAAAGAAVLIVLVEAGVPSALLTYGAAAAITLMTAEPEAKILFVMFFGYYPVVKGVFDKKLPKALSWVLKTAVFNSAMLISYYLIINIFGMNVFGGEKAKLTFELLLLAAGNVVFVIYDIALQRFASLYLMKIHPKISRYLS